MIISKKCLNCNHVATQDINTQACPACQAVYSKVEAALIRPVGTPESFLASPKRAPAPSRFVQDENFIATLRADSNYPNFRILVKLATWFFYLLALGTALVVLLNSGLPSSVRIGTIFGAVVMAVFITAAKEASLMLADLSDAAVHTAARQERSQQ